LLTSSAAAFYISDKEISEIMSAYLQSLILHHQSHCFSWPTLWARDTI